MTLVLPQVPPPPPNAPLSRTTTSVVVAGDTSGGGPDAALLVDILRDLNLDWTEYSFMLPVSLLVAFLANTAGIGGAALFAPIYLLVFPLLDVAMSTRYTLASPAAAVGTALAVEAFGFTSGLVGYARRGLIDFAAAAPLCAVAVPCAFLGASFVSAVPLLLLKGAYAGFMLVTGTRLFVGSAREDNDGGEGENARGACPP